MRPLAKFFTVAAMLAVPAASASAADLYGAPQDYVSGITNQSWTVTIGGYGAADTTFLGSKNHEFGFIPIFDIRRTGENEGLNLPNEAASFSVFDRGPLHIGFAANYEDSRDHRDDRRALQGLHDINYTIELGAFAEYWVAPNLRTRLELLQGVNGSEGFVANLSADYVFRPDARWQFTVGPRLAFGNTQRENEYFGVRYGESLASGLPTYRASGGLESVGVLGSARYNVTERFSIRGFAEYERLMDDAGDSPIVQYRGSEDQWRVGVGAAYTFDIGNPLPASYK